jgi:hypothetical protein
VIYPRGTSLADVPPDFRGVSWNAWLYLQVRTPASTPADAQAWLLAHPLKTARDDYRWRGSRSFIDRTKASTGPQDE